MLRRMIRDRIQVASIEQRDPVWTPYPETTPVILYDLVDTVARQSLLGRVMSQLALLPPKKAVVARAEPETLIGVFVDCPDLLLTQTDGGSIVHKDPSVESIQPTVSSDPQITMAIFKQGAGAEIRQAVAHLIILETARCPVAHALIGCDPHASLAALQECTNKIVYQAVFGSHPQYLFAIHADNSIPVRPDPQRSPAVTKQIAHRDMLQPWKVITFDRPFAHMENICGDHQRRAIAVRIDGAKIRIGRLRQRHNSHWSAR